MLVLLSLAFYAYGNPPFILLLIASIAINWLAALAYGRVFPQAVAGPLARWSEVMHQFGQKVYAPGWQRRFMIAILRIVVDATDDGEFLDPSGHEQFAVRIEKAEIAGAQPCNDEFDAGRKHQDGAVSRLCGLMI